MSKSIIIDEAGLPKALTVDALRINKQGGGSEDWLPKDDTNLVELDIGGSGTYRASNYGAYGIAVARVTPKYGGGATSKAAQQPAFENLHTPAIREGGNPKYMGARLLKTNLQGGGTCLWVPEDEANLESKYVDHSGTYTAQADGCYGYSQINVSGVDVEIKKDDDGDDIVEITDGGETKTQKLPSAIVVTTLPSDTVYNDGDTIDFNGIVVRAYLKSGGVWRDNDHPNGVIPLSELIFPVNTADIDSSERETASSDIVPEPFECSSSGNTKYGPKPPEGEEDHEANRYESYDIPDGKLTLSGTIGGKSIQGLYASSSSSSSMQRIVYYPQGGSRSTTHTVNQYYTYNGRTVHYGTWTSEWTYSSWILKEINPDGATSDRERRAWTMIYGYIDPAGQRIPVQWNRPIDNKTLETSFKITVNPSAPGYGSEE